MSDLRYQRPFWMHQAVEYVIALIVLAQGFQSQEPAIPLACGALILLNVAVAQGPIGAFGLVPKRLHRQLDVVVMVAVAVAAVQPWVDVENLTRAVLVIVALGLWLVWFNTSFGPSPLERRRAERSAQASDPARLPAAGRSKPNSSPLRPSAEVSAGERIGRNAGKVVAAGIRTWRRRGAGSKKVD